MMLYPKNEILLPAKRSFIALTLFVGLLVNLLPWSGWLLILKPDFVALVLLYWCIYQPRKTGFVAAFTIGLLMDIVNGTLFGQHALAYSVLAFAGIILHRRMQMLALKDLMLHVIALLLLNDFLVLTIRMLSGASFPGIAYFGGSLISGLAWPWLYRLLTLPQRPKPDPDYV
jgi:rod shape-determining protein MreD